MSFRKNSFPTARARFVACFSFTLLAVLFALPVETDAQVRTWSSATSGDWDLAGNWTGGTPDTPTESAVLGGSTTYTVAYRNLSLTIDSLSIDNSLATLLIETDTGNTNLTVENDVTNNGTIRIDSDSGFDPSLTVNSGTLTNNGTVSFGGTSTSGTTLRSLSADVVNNGLFRVDQNARLTRNNGVFTNNSLVDIATGKTLDFGAATATFNMNGGTVKNSGAFNFSGDTLNFNAGNFTDNAISLNNSTLNIGTGSTGTGVFNMTGLGNYNGDLAAAQTINITPGSGNTTITATSDFDNNGTINLDSDNGFDVLLTRDGSITNNATINFGGTSDDGVTLRRLSADVTNNGTVNVNQNGRLTRNGGTFNNDGTVNIATDRFLDFESATGTFVQDSGSVNNLGSFNFLGDTLNFNGGNFSGNAVSLNNSTLNIGAGSTGTGEFNMTGLGNYSGDLAAAQTLNINPGTGNTTITAADDFTNNGTINLDSDNGFDVLLTRAGSITNDATVNFGGTSDDGFTIRRLSADVVNNGTVNVNQNGRLSRNSGIFTNNSSVNIASGKTLDFDTALGTFNHEAGTVDNQGSFNFSGDTLNFNGGVFSGNAISMNNSTLNIGAGSTGAGVFDMTGLGNYSGDLAVSQTVNINPGTGNTVITAAADFTNNGTFNLDSDNGFDSSLTLAGTLTNEGLMNFGGTSDSGVTLRQLSADVINNGSFNINQNARLTRNTGVFTNNNEVNIAAGRTLDFATATGKFNQDGGNVDNQGAFNFAGDTLNFNGGDFSGNAISLSNSTLNIGVGSTGTGEFDMSGLGTYSGNLAAAQTVNINPGTGNTVVTATGDFTNSGTINLDSDNGFDVTLARAGRITNDGTINYGGTGTSGVTFRRLSAEIDNNGLVDFITENTSHKFGTAGADHINNGTLFNREDGSIVEFLGSSFTNDIGGSLNGVGEYDFTQTGLVSNGIIDPGTSPGILHLDGTINLGTTSEIAIEIGGLAQGSEYDLLNVYDFISLDGDLNFGFINGFENSVSNSDTFTVLTAGTLSGTFAGIADGDTVFERHGNGSFTLNYSGNSVVLSNFQPNAIPEPATAGLIACTLGVLMIRRKRA
ncbi:MAG: hypothetical protein AAF456_00570 [Planctomycetota bacterium]